MEPSVPTSLPDPLALTSAEFAAVASGAIVIDRWGGTPGAMEAYRRFHRAGPGAVPQLSSFVPKMQTLDREPVREGEVIKFLTPVPRALSAPPREGSTLSLLPDELVAESVLIPMISSQRERTYTLCVSSQIGCAMGCTFCETAQMGLIRSLTAREIVAQWYNAAHHVSALVGRDVRPKNIVFMGMGEPMDNLDEVIKAVAILKDHNGPHIAVSNITISTVGRVDGIRRLAEKIHEPGWRRLGIALSLNAPNDKDRSAIMPINRKYDLAMVREALLNWPKFAGNKVCIEYVLIPGVNDSLEHARQIAEFIEPFGLVTSGRLGGQSLRAVLNVIPYNPRRNSPWPAPTDEQVEQFMQTLIGLHVFVKQRRTKGRRLMGACGQLGSEHIRSRRLVLTDAQ